MKVRKKKRAISAAVLTEKHVMRPAAGKNILEKTKRQNPTSEQLKKHIRLSWTEMTVLRTKAYAVATCGSQLGDKKPAAEA